MDWSFKTDSTAGAEQTCCIVDGLMCFIDGGDDVHQRSDCSNVDGHYVPLPQRVAMPPPVTSGECHDQPEHQGDLFWAQISDALGVELTSVDMATREACVVGVMRLFKQCLSGLQQSLRVRNEVVDELNADFSKTDHHRFSAFECASSEAIIDCLLRRGQKPLVTEGLISQAFRELQAHEVSMLAGCRAVAQAALDHFSPHQLAWQFERDRGKPWLLTDARRWRDYVRHYRDLKQDKTLSKVLLAQHFAPAYEQQFRLIVNAHQDLQEYTP